MQRKQFLLTSLAALPAFALANNSQAKTRTAKPFVVKSGTNRDGQPMINFMGIHPNDVVVSKRDTDGQFSVFLFSGKGVVGTPLHVHYHQDEFFSVIEGQYRFVCGDLTTELKAGDTIFLPRNIPHQWLQISKTGKLIYAVNPAGELEDFFKEVNDLKKPTPEAIDKLALKHGVKHLGPPLTL